ncbi:MAG: alpha/beta fold hydrolase [Nitriliruptoraceae bacterium]
MHEPQLLRVPVADAEVAVLAIGSPSGRPVVLIPGLSDGLAPVDDDAARALYASAPLPMDRTRGLVLSYRAPVRPGIGTPELAADLQVVLASLLDRPAVLVAHSLGGMVAQHLAAAAPELVAGLVLTACPDRADGQLRAVLARWDAWLGAGEHRRFRRDAVVTSVTGESRHTHLALDAASTVGPPSPARVARHLALSAACAGHDATARLASITAQTLVLAGGRDALVGLARSRALADALTEARLEVFADLGHGFPEQARGPFQARVGRFLAELGWDGAGQ